MGRHSMARPRPTAQNQFPADVPDAPLGDRDIGHNVVPTSPDATPAGEIPFWTALAKIYTHGGWLILAIALMIAPWITWLLLR